MKALPLLASVVALVGLAAPAHADPDDDAFLAALTKAGISYQNPDKAVKAGQKVCDLANSGTSQLDIVRDIRDLNPSFTMTSAAKFAKPPPPCTAPNDSPSTAAAPPRPPRAGN